MSNKFVLSAMGKRVDFDALAAGAPKKARQEVKRPKATPAPERQLSGHRPAPPAADDFSSLVSVFVEKKDATSAPPTIKEPRGKRAQAD